MYQTISNAPEAFIAQKRNRVRQYDNNTVYLKDGDEFELELFNPKSRPVLAKIKLNGNFISYNGIVLRPGERVFLDRFIDTNNKFLFSTYEVDKNNPSVQKAIANNGNVEIYFYDEMDSLATWASNTYYTGVPYRYTDYTYTVPPNYYSGGGTGTGSAHSYSHITGFAGTFGWSGQSGASGASFMSDDTECQYSNLSETGRVEKGNPSDTNFETVFNNFNGWTSRMVSWKILPLSQKPVYSDEIKQYCPNCRYRLRKSSWKFCPQCGEEL